jgi:hypothetical protein
MGTFHGVHFFGALRLRGSRKSPKIVEVLFRVSLKQSWVTLKAPHHSKQRWSAYFIRRPFIPLDWTAYPRVLVWVA